MRFSFFTVSGTIAMAIALAACSGGSTSPTPQSQQQTQQRDALGPENLSRIAPGPTKINAETGAAIGPWGVSFGDTAAGQFSNENPVHCSTPATPGNCNGYVQKYFLADALTVTGTDPVSGATDSARLNDFSTLGLLMGQVTARASIGSYEGVIQNSGASGAIIIGWEDTFAITGSSAMPAGTPVTFTGTLSVVDSNPAVSCAAGATLIEATMSGLSPGDFSIEDCSGSIFGFPSPPVGTSSLNTTVGSTITLIGALDVSTGASTFDANDANYTGRVTAVFHLDPVTPGASYTTASGRTYFTPTPLPLPTGPCTGNTCP